MQEVTRKPDEKKSWWHCNYSEGSIPRGVLACFLPKSARHTRQSAITEGDLECILTRNCEGTEQLRGIYYCMANHFPVLCIS